MPLTLRPLKEGQRSSLLHLQGEMPERDFSGPHCDWYYDSFRCASYDANTASANKLKLDLAIFLNSTIKGPYWIHEGYAQGAGGSFPETLHIIMLYASDRIAFRAAWSERFVEAPEAELKNLREIMCRVAEGYVHQDQRLQIMTAALTKSGGTHLRPK